jgi:hypothetical protein
MNALLSLSLSHSSSCPHFAQETRMKSNPLGCLPIEEIRERAHWRHWLRARGLRSRCRRACCAGERAGISSLESRARGREARRQRAPRVRGWGAHQWRASCVSCTRGGQKSEAQGVLHEREAAEGRGQRATGICQGGGGRQRIAMEMAESRAWRGNPLYSNHSGTLYEIAKKFVSYDSRGTMSVLIRITILVPPVDESHFIVPARPNCLCTTRIR